MNTNNDSFQRPQSLLSKVCRCISFQNKKLMETVNINKLQWKGFKRQSETNTLPPIFALLIDLYDGLDVYEGLEKCRINPDFTSKKLSRNDFEYYVPQLTNFMAFHGDFTDQKLNNFLESLSIADPYFAHLYYWYINSLSQDVEKQKGSKTISNILKMCSKESQTQVFLKDYEKFYDAIKERLDKDEYYEKIKELQSRQGKISQVLHQYKTATKTESVAREFPIKATDLELKPYISPFHEGNEAYSSNPFTSTLLFFEDLYQIAQAMTAAENKLQFLKKKLRKVNRALPSSVYIPFVKDSIRCYAILDIIVEETRVFNTKERSPIYVCLELFNPHVELAYEYNILFPAQEGPHKKKLNPKGLVKWVKKKIIRKENKNYIKMGHDLSVEKLPSEDFKLSKLNQIISSPVTLKQNNEMLNHSMSDRKVTEKNPLHVETPPKTVDDLDKIEGNQELPLSPHFGEKVTINLKESEEQKIDFNEVVDKTPTPKKDIACNLSPFTDIHSLGNYFKNDPNEEKEGNGAQAERQIEETFSANTLSTDPQKDQDIYFGEDSKAQEKRIRSQSPFGVLKTWRMLPMIVKTGADMKEEQFAVQLISQFDQIFKEEKLKLILTPYEIVSLGPDVGLVEVIQDATTLSNLKEKLYQQNIPSLNKFFEYYYGKDVEKARKKFCRSLAAYSLICYFLQIKDRHNGNIFLHKLGHIIHIDFGFFLSNAPGRGLEFERKVPFKLLNEYIEVLGGFRSSLFQEFRKLFYKGFMAARKHREQILILVKMMYSSQGSNLPCFKAGLRAISELEQRFSPEGVAEKDLMGYCYNMINQSVDNWRAKCYDKFQYYVQGVYY